MVPPGARLLPRRRQMLSRFPPAPSSRSPPWSPRWRARTSSRQFRLEQLPALVRVLRRRKPLEPLRRPRSTGLGRTRVAVPLVVTAGLLSLVAAREDVLDVVGTRWALGALAVLAGVSAAALLAATRVGRLLAMLGRDTLAVYVTTRCSSRSSSCPDRDRSHPWADGARWSAPAVLVVTAASLALLLRKPLSAVPHLLRAPWAPRARHVPADRDGERGLTLSGPGRPTLTRT